MKQREALMKAEQFQREAAKQVELLETEISYIGSDRLDK